MTSTATARQAKKQHQDQQAAVIRARLERQRRRRRHVLFATVAGFLAVVVTLVVVGVNSGGTADTAGTGRQPLPAGVLDKVIGIPAATLDAVGAGTSTQAPRPVTDDPLTADGKPLVLYFGAEYCPFCAVERWPLVQALSRFGTFAGLSATRSAEHDVHPLTASFTFYGSSYSSPYLTFEAKEIYTNEIKNGRYTTLEKLTPWQEAIFNRYGAATPLVDFAGKYVVSGATYPADLIHALDWDQIAAPLGDPANPIAKGIDGAANVITATLCRLTDGQPAKVCTAPGVQSASKKLAD